MKKSLLLLALVFGALQPAWAAPIWELEIEYPGGYRKTFKADALKKVDLARSNWSCELSPERKLSSSSASRILTCRQKYHPTDVVEVVGFCRMAETNLSAVNLTDKSGSYAISISCDYK